MEMVDDGMDGEVGEGYINYGNEGWWALGPDTDWD
jgi:hypothetical protein